MRTSLTLCVAFAFLALVACNENRVSKERKELPNMVWKQGQEESFTVDIQDPSLRYELTLGLNHHANVGWESLEVAMTILSPSGARDEKRYTVKVKEGGDFVGNVSGDYGDVYQTLEGSYEFPEAGQYQIKLAQAEAENVPGVMGLSLIVDKKPQ